MLSFSKKLIEKLKHLQTSLFVWFLLTYGVLYLIGIFTTKTIYSKFETNFANGIALQTFEKRAQILQSVQNYFQYKNPEAFSNFISTLNKDENNITTILTPINAKSITLPNNIIWNHIPWDKFKECALKTKRCPLAFMNSQKPSLPSQFEGNYVYTSLIKINKIPYMFLFISNPNVLSQKYLGHIKVTEHLFEFILFLGFICCIFISYGAVRPVTQFIKKIKHQKLNSEVFQTGAHNELNHMRAIRTTIYEALVRKEDEENERLTMQNSLVSQQKEAEIGKIVSQISHDLKSPLVIFENLLQENSYENFTENYESAKRSFNKIMSLVSSLKQADKESLINRTHAHFSLDSIIDECKTYAQSKDLEFESKINLSETLLLLDHAKVERSVNNLLRNAVEYAKSKIILEVTLSHDILNIKIYDNGSGVSAAMLPRLFQWRSTGNDETGTGIGLYYARQIALAHGGDLTYSHRNGLTQFHFVLPGVFEGHVTHNKIPLMSRQRKEQVSHGQKCIVFYLKNPEKYDIFYSFMSEKELPSVFFNELSSDFQQISCHTLYTDSSEAIVDTFIENGVHIILNKETDTPAQIYERLVLLTSNIIST